MVLWIGAIDLVKLRLDHVVLQLLSGLRLVVVHSVRRYPRSFRLGVIVLVEFLDVKATTALVHVHSLVAHWALDLNSLSSVAFLGIKFPSVTTHRLNSHNLTLLVVTGSVIVWG